MAGRRSIIEFNFLILMILFISALVLVILTAIIAQTQFLSIVETHNEERFALLIATRLTGAPDLLMDWGYQGGHKNLVDSRKLDALVENYERTGTMPYSAYTYCYEWFAIVDEPSTGRKWGFGAEEFSGGTPDSAFSYSATGKYTLPVTIADYSGGRITGYSFGTLTVHVGKGSGCADASEAGKQLEEAQELIQAAKSRAALMAGEEFSYFGKSADGAEYLRCEELDAAGIADKFPPEEAAAIAGFDTAEIEAAASGAKIDPNLLRAAILGWDGIPSDLGVAAAKIRAALEISRGYGECAPNFVSYGLVSGQDRLERYAAGEIVPAAAEQAAAEKITNYYYLFSSCYGVAGA